MGKFVGKNFSTRMFLAHVGRTFRWTSRSCVQSAASRFEIDPSACLPAQFALVANSKPVPNQPTPTVF